MMIEPLNVHMVVYHRIHIQVIKPSTDMQTEVYSDITHPSE